MPAFVCKSFEFTRLYTGSKADEYGIIFYAYSKKNRSGKVAGLQIIQKGENDPLVVSLFDAMAKAWPEKTITFDVSPANAILSVLSVP